MTPDEYKNYEFGDLLTKIAPDPSNPVSTQTYVSTQATPANYAANAELLIQVEAARAARRANLYRNLLVGAGVLGLAYWAYRKWA